MLYLLIPLLVCAFLALWASATFTTDGTEMVRTGTVSDLDPILSVLMTAAYGDPSVVIKPGLSDDRLKVTFPEGHARLEVFLDAGSEAGRRARCLAVLGDLGLSPIATGGDGEGCDLTCEVEGPVDSVARVIKEAFLRLFDVDSGHEAEFRVTAHYHDQSVITRALTTKPVGDSPNKPAAMTRGRDSESVTSGRRGCLGGLVQLLLLPVPFMWAYLQFGVAAASAMLIAILLIREVYQRYKRQDFRFRFLDLLKLLIVGLSGVTALSGDPLYLQLVPIVVLSVAAAAQLLVAVFNLRPIFPEEDIELSKAIKWLFTFAIVVTCVCGAIFYDYLRTCCSLDSWMWFFAFARLELLLGLLTAAMPMIFYQVFGQVEETCEVRREEETGVKDERP